MLSAIFIMLFSALRYKSLQVMYNELHEGIVRTAHRADEYMARLKRIKDAIIGYSNDD